ncbi:hypothetical protein E2C01_012632 [Portunus trituberculatus]|uniref:Uncharacterized protein n=1 Tax=Portunus trituberculatus TaxID=210409 RepID=A0A5B7DER8_PORTR|nr:hypothetical protein [Portunus trituberculatus]
MGKRGEEELFTRKDNICTEEPEHTIRAHSTQRTLPLLPFLPLHHHYNQHLHHNATITSITPRLPPRQHPEAWERNEAVQFGVFILHTSPFDQHLPAPRVRPTFMAAECERLEGRKGGSVEGK